MANIIVSADVQTAIATATSEQTGFEAPNAVDWTHPNRPWKATDCVPSTTALTLTFSGTRHIDALVLSHLNVSSVIVDFGTGPTVTAAVSQDPRDGQRKVWVPANLSTAAVIVYANSATTDGEAGMRIGSAVAFGVAQPWVRNPGFGYEVTPQQGNIPNDNFVGGGREPVITGNRYVELSISQSVMPLDGAADVWAFLALGEGTPFVYYRNGGDTSEVYIAHRVGRASLTQASAVHHSFSSILIEECV